MKFAKVFLDTFANQASANPRMLQSFDLRTNQMTTRMLNVMESGVVMPIC